MWKRESVRYAIVWTDSGGRAFSLPSPHFLQLLYVYEVLCLLKKSTSMVLLNALHLLTVILATAPAPVQHTEDWLLGRKEFLEWRGSSA
jgi:hypothetical protein